MNLSVLLDMAADGFGDRTVIGRRAGGLTARRLRELSIGGARAIRAARADAVIYLAPNGPAFPVALFAAARAGVPLVPINYRLGAEQLTVLLANHPGAIGISPTGAVDRLTQWGMASSTTDDWLAAIGELADDTDEGTDPDPATAAAL